MLYLRNTNQQQSLGKDIKRGITNVCCTPTLNSVTTASLTQLNIDGTFGTYLVNCKSCVGGYIEVSENSGSSWTTINPGNCSTNNLVPQPSQSAYYRLFTSCSSNNQPFDPLVSDYSNEIQFIPYGIVNYNFIEQPGASGLFKFYDDSELLVNASSSVSGTFWEILSASYATASIQCLSVPLTGSTSMSLLVTGSGVSYYTASCAQSGGIFLDDWKVEPHKFYDVTASLNFRPENTCTASAYTDLGYTVNSYDQTTGRWYHANQYGVADTSSTYPYATLIGTSTAVKTNIASGDCRFNAIQFSGSMQLTTSAQYASVYLAIVSGSFSISGTNQDGNGWSLSSAYDIPGSGSANISFGGGGATSFTYQNQPTKNSMIGMRLESPSGPFGRREVTYFVSGSGIATNPPFTSQQWNGNLGTNLTLSGVGIIRGFSYETPGDLNLQSQYNCIYDTTPSK
jgi:hypothetical protein